MPINNSKLAIRIAIALVLSMIGSLALFGSRYSAASISTQPVRQPRALKAVGEANPYIKLQESRDLQPSYAGAGAATISSAMLGTKMRPLALASGDLNDDGYPDLVCGYGSAGGGMLTLYRGDPQAYAPTDPEVIEGIARSEFPDPFLEEAAVYELAEAPDFVGTGDFNRDGKIDLVVAARGGRTLYLLEGDGAGRLANPLSIPLPGAVSAMVAGGINNRDGLVDVMLGIDSPSGSSLLVYDGIKSILETTGIEYSLPAKATSLALGTLDDDGYEDLAILANGQVLILHGHDNSNDNDARASKKAGKLETVETPFSVKAFALGEFIWDRDSRVEMAMMADDGSVHIIARGELDTRPWTQEEMQEKRREMARIRDKAEKRRGKSGPAMVTETVSPVEALDWRMAEDMPAPANGSISAAAAGSGDSSVPPLLFSTRISTLPSDDLLIVNPANRQLQLRYKETPKDGDAQLASKSAERSSFSADLDSDVTAALPMRVNVDGRPGFVTMSRGRGAPSVFMPLAAMTFNVTKTADTNDGACTVGDCSLREAIVAANANPGADTITFTAGINPTLTITSGGGHEDAAATGDLDINDSVTITGNNPTVISTSYTNTCGDCKVFGVNQPGTNNGLAVSFTGVTIQNGFNDGTNFSGTFFETGGGIDFFLTGSGNNSSMTNCTITNNKTQNGARSHGGGVNVDGRNTATAGGPSGGSITFTSCTITNNSSTADGGGGIFLAADKHDTTLTNCVITGNSCSGGTGGGVQVTQSFGGTVTINGASGSVSNNTASTSGGGIMVTFNQVTNISSITISNNTATGTGGSSLGGGVLIDTLGAAGVTGSTSLTNVTISTNHANNGANAIGGGVRYGGFYAATMSGCTVSNNTSKDGAGVGNAGSTQTPAGTLAISTGSFTGNAATGNGGAFVSIGTGSPTASVTTFSNVMIGGTGVGQPNTAVNGGGIADTQTGSVTVTSNSISGNTATTSGGGVFISGGTLTLDGVTVDNSTATNGDGLHQSGGTFTGANTVSFNAGDSVNIVGGTFNSTPGTLNLTGNFTNSGGSFNHNNGTVIFNGTTAQSLGGSTSSAFNILTVNKTGTLTLTGAANESIANVAGGGNLTVTAGTFDLSTFTINRAAAGGTLTVSNGATLKIGGTNTLPSNFNTHSIGATSTIDYSGSSQTVATLNSAQKYGNLLTSGSGTKTLAGNISVATLLSIGASTTLDASATNFNINDAGNWTNAGTFTPRSATVTFDGSSGTQTLTGNTTFFNLTLNNAGATTAFGATSTTIGNNLVTSGGTMDGGTSTITFTGATGSISGANTKNFNNLVINSGAVITNTTGGNTNISNDYTDNGTFTQAAALTTTFNTGADGNHSFSGNGTTTFGNFTINGSNTVDAGSHNFNVVGASLTVTGTFTGNTSTVTLNGAVAQTILGNGTKNFSGLTINNASGVTVNDTTPVVDATVSGALTLTTNLTIAAGAVVQQSGTSAGAGDAIGTIRRTDLGVTARAFGNLNNTIAVDTGTAPTQMDVTLALVAPPDFTTSVTRTYTLTPTGGSGISATVKLHYLNAQLNGNTEAKLGLWKKVTGVWVVQGRTGAVDTVNKAVTLSGVSSFSDWTLADMADVSVTVAPASVLEDSGTALVYTFARTGGTTQALLVNFSVGGTATPPGGATPDYSQTGADTFTTTTGTVTIGVGNATATVSLTPTADTVVEPDETAILTVTAGTTYNVVAPSTATGTITNDDADVSVAVSPLSTSEDGATNLVYTFTRVGATAGALTVNFSVGGTATFNTDYTQTGAATFDGSTGTVTFGAGNSTATVTVDPTADSTVEPDETVILTVTAGTGYNVSAPSAATGTITNDDADVSVAVSPASVLEDGATNLVYTFTRTGFTGAALTINFSVGGTATFNTDYTQTGAATFNASSGTVTFTGTNTTTTVTIDPTTDATAENNETVILTVTSGTGYNPAAPTSATGTILDDDSAVSVAVSPASVAEDGATNLVYTFTRTGDISAALTVNFSVSGTATFSTDYTQTGADTFTASAGTVTFAAANATTTVTLDPSSDTTVEPDETAILTVTSGTGYVVGSPSAATGTITNDDTDVSVAVSPTSVTEDGATNLVYTFTRSGVTTGVLTANFSVGGTATFNTDYTQTGAATFTASSGTVTFGAGNTTATVTVDPTADTTVEPDETVILTVTSGTGYNVGAPSAATGTISNDDADVSVAVSPASVAEDGATNLVYTFTRTGFTTGALTINFSVGGTATFSTDYTQTGAATFTASTGTVTFGAGNATTTVTVDPTADATGEADETVILTVTSGTGYNPVAPTSATGTILNDDTAVSVAVSPTSVAEDGATNMTYTFTRTGDTSASLLVNFTVGGTATFNTDYTQSGADTFTASTGTITITTGNASASLTIDPTADMTVEPDETVVLTVAAGSGYAPGPPNPATGTILNDDTDVSVAVSPSSVAEDGATNLVFTFTRSGVTTGALTANFTVGGTADSSSDYTQSGAATFTPPTGTVTFGAGSSTATVTVDPTADTTVEPDETVILTVTSGTGYNVGAPSSATGTITNDDTDVSLTVSPSSVFEDGATNLVYTFSRTGVTASPLTVNFSVGGTATFSTDYTQTGAATFGVSSGTVTFGAGNSTATVTVDPSADATPEPDETVILTLTAGTGYTPVNPMSATGTIINDDTDVSVAVSPSSVFEDGATNLVYTFTRVGITTGALTVNFTVGGTAVFGTDYGQSGADAFSTSAGMVTIGAGNSTATVTIDPSADLTVEPDETVILTVASGTGYNPSGPAATGTILNDDTDVTVAVSPASTSEDSATNLVYTFTRTGVTTGALTVNFSVGGTATFSTDYTQTGAATYTASAGMVTIGAGNSTATVTVDPTTDTTVEPDETVILMVTSGTGYNIGMPDTATGTITNDDTDVTMTLSPSSVGEDGSTNLVYTFTRSGVTTGPLTVNFSVAGTATFTSDYTQTGAATYGASSGTVTIASGNATATVSLTPVNDAKVEGNETAALAITSGSYGIGTPNSATGTIVDNDTATVAFASSSSNAPEQTATHNVGVTLTITANGAGTPMLERTVMVNVQDLGTGSATGGGVDYTYTNPQTVTFASGDIAQTKNVVISIVNDNLSEGNETINFALNTLVDGTGGQVSLVSPTSDTVTIVDNDIDLKVTKTESADPVAAGGGPGNLTYTVKVKNNGLTAATGVMMSESFTLPSGVTVDSVMVNVGSVSGSSPNYTWNIGSLGVGVEGTLTAVLTVAANTAAGTNTICDTATITASTENRVNTGDDSAMECTSVVAQADVEITSKTDAPDPVCVGGDITYTVSYKNNGPGPGINAKVMDGVPANTTLVSASTMSAGWSRTDSVPFGGTGNIKFMKSSSPNGETASFTIVVRVNAGTVHGTVITNTATASSDLLDPAGSNNSKMTTTTVDPNAPTIACPANVTAITNQNVCQQGGCQTVNYAVPAAMDDCPGVQVVCVPPSGSCMPTGSTTVMCTATDTAGNTASCSFSVTVFDVCLQDDSNPGTVLLFNSLTGAYKFCCAGTTYSGTGTVVVKGCTITLTHNPSDRRLSASVDKTGFKGTASLQSPPGVMKCSITDRDIRNNSCNCQ